MKPRFLLSSALLLGAIWSCRAGNSPVLSPATEPQTETMWTSTREIRALSYNSGTFELWAATAGGVLRTASRAPRKWTRKTGLPSNEALEIESRGAAKNDEIAARFPLHRAVWGGKGWTQSAAPPFGKTAPQIVWNGKIARATLDGLEIGGRKIANPPSSGTHISALFGAGKILVAAFYGDGLWNYDGQKWRPDARNAGLTPQTREITALAGGQNSLFIGTRRAGAWASYHGGAWRSFADEQNAEIFNANIQNFAEFQSVLWASTLDDGLVYRSGADWGHVSTPTLGSSAPRQMQVFQNRLYVRFGGGTVDSFDGQNWTQNALKTVPRQGVYALAGDEKVLFAAGWGGWSEWDGAQWTPHFDVPELQGVPLMGLLLDGDDLWIASQSRGLGRYHRSDHTFRWFDERDNLPDDWVTSTARFGGKIYAGTFVGGLARLDGEKWHVFPALRGSNVTALAASDGKLYAATRSGIWEIEGDDAVRIEKSWLDPEVQALWSGKTGLWIGARTSLSWLRGGQSQIR